MSTTSPACMMLIWAYPPAARVSGTPSRRRARPLDQRDHRTDLEHEDRGEQAHLCPEEMIMEIVEAALLESAEGPRQAGADPQDRRHAPPGVGVERPAEFRGIELASERATTGPDRAQSDAEGQQVDGSQEPSQRHCRCGSRSTPASGPCVNAVFVSM